MTMKTLWKMRSCPTMVEFTFGVGDYVLEDKDVFMGGGMLRSSLFVWNKSLPIMLVLIYLQVGVMFPSKSLIPCNSI